MTCPTSHVQQLVLCTSRSTPKLWRPSTIWQPDCSLASQVLTLGVPANVRFGEACLCLKAALLPTPPAAPLAVAKLVPACIQCCQPYLQARPVIDLLFSRSMLSQTNGVCHHKKCLAELSSMCSRSLTANATTGFSACPCKHLAGALHKCLGHIRHGPQCCAAHLMVQQSHSWSHELQPHTCCTDGSLAAIQPGTSGSGMAASEPPAASAGGSAFGLLAGLRLRSSAGGWAALEGASLAACLACMHGQTCQVDCCAVLGLCSSDMPIFPSKSQADG